jgi:peptidoglycan hydrolase-like protein with peptidoglycan-binding domain
MLRWLPAAVRDVMPDAGEFVAGPYRGIIHTTEGDTYAGARGAYIANRSAPHFTCYLAPTGFLAYQHVGLDRAARALANLSGGVETNRRSAIQLEVVARAGKPAWPEPLVAGVRDLMIAIEKETGIKPHTPQFLGSVAYGVRGPARMTAAAWNSFDGWCGHQHVPENAHWDPGAINPAPLLERFVPEPPSPPPPGADLGSRLMTDAPVLARGAKGHHVRILQGLLIVHAPDLVGSDWVGFLDGDFGPTTERVLSTWQSRTTLSARGVADGPTWAWLVGV